MLRGFLVLTVFLVIGESLSFVLDWPVSGGILGMVLMTLWLLTQSGAAGTDVGAASQQLISILVVLILPGVVGVFFLGGQFDGQWLAVGVALVLGTLASVATTFVLMMALLPKTVGKEQRD